MTSEPRYSSVHEFHSRIARPPLDVRMGDVRELNLKHKSRQGCRVGTFSRPARIPTKYHNYHDPCGRNLVVQMYDYERELVNEL